MLVWTWRRMARWGFWVGLLLALACPALALDTVTTETVRTEDGIFTLERRVPARETDLGLAIYPGVIVRESFMYTIRDRKAHDLETYARARFTTPTPARDVVRYYQEALGAGARRDTNKETGEVTMVAGTKDDLRLVTVTPLDTECAVRLERVQRFAVPARIYTEDEGRVLQVLGDLRAAYTGARRVAYRVELRNEKTPVDPRAKPTAAVAWLVDFERPGNLLVTASMEGVVALRMTTKDGQLCVARQQLPEEKRAIGDGITLESIPELRDDPAARLMLGDDLAAHADTLTMTPVADAAGQQDLLLTYPDFGVELRLRIDTTKKTILRCETTVDTAHDKLHQVRTYSNVVLDLPAERAGLPRSQPPSQAMGPVAGTAT